MTVLRQLPNGLTLVCQTRPGASTTALGLFWLAGSRFEGPAEAGAAHLLEHLLLAGRGQSRAVLGGQVDASTGRELISLTGITPAEHAGELLVLLMEALARPDFGALAREQAVIQLERQWRGDGLVDSATAMAWAGHPLGRPITGVEGSLPELSVVEGFRRRLLSAQRLWLVAVGPQSPDWLARRVGWLADLPAGDSPQAAPPAVFQAGWFRRPADGGPGQALWLLPVAGAASGVDHGLLMLAQLLGGGGDSRLFQTLRERHGWIYGIEHWLEQYRETGLWGISMACQPERLTALLETVTDTVEALLDAPPDAAELARLGWGLESRLLLDEADPARCLARLARETVYLGSPMSIDEHRLGLGSVDGAMLRERLQRAWAGQLRLCLH